MLFRVCLLARGDPDADTLPLPALQIQGNFLMTFLPFACPLRQADDRYIGVYRNSSAASNNFGWFFLSPGAKRRLKFGFPLFARLREQGTDSVGNFHAGGVFEMRDFIAEHIHALGVDFLLVLGQILNFSLIEQASDDFGEFKRVPSFELIAGLIDIDRVELRSFILILFEVNWFRDSAEYLFGEFGVHGSAKPPRVGGGEGNHYFDFPGLKDIQFAFLAIQRHFLDALDFAEAQTRLDDGITDLECSHDSIPPGIC
jgi:hypothetical protein